MPVMDTVVVCSACGYANTQESGGYCAGCRVPLSRAAHVSADEAERIGRRRRAAFTRRRIARWGVAALIIACALAWTGYRVFAPPSWSAPQSDISSAPAGIGDWPMLQRDPSRAGFADADAEPPVGETVWTLRTAAPLSSAPSVADGVVYLSSGDKRILALNAESGAIVWEYPVSGPVDSSPAVAGGLVIVGLRDSRVVALNKEDGSLAWEYDAGEPVHSSPVVYDGVAYIGSGDYHLHAVDAASGERRWTYETGGRILHGVAVNDEVVALNSQDRRVHIVDKDTGRYRLSVFARETRGAPALDGDRVYIAEVPGSVFAADWSQRHLPFERFAEWGRRTLVIWGLVDTLPLPKGFEWRFRARGEAFAGVPALAADMAFVGSDTGAAIAIRRADGERAWTHQGSAPITTSPAVVGDTLYVGDKDGVLRGLDIRTGEPVWRFQLDGEAVSAIAYADGTLYANTKAGTLYAIR